MSERKAVLHIGTMKTGTTSIQATLLQNPRWIAKRGYAYSGQKTSDQIARQIAAMDSGQNLIISNEGLWHFANSDRSDTAEIARVLRENGFTVEVLVYFRRPDAFIEAWYAQGLKHGSGVASVSKFQKSPFVRAGCDFAGRLKIFSDLFGTAAIRIAPYERAQLAQGDVVTDFLVRCGLAGADDTLESLAASGLILPPMQNVSPDANVMLLVSLLRNLGHLPEDALKQLQKAVPLQKNKDAGRILTPEEVTAINARYLPVFRQLQAQYGGGGGPDFFLDWAAKPADARACAMRGVYDQLIDPVVPKPVPPPPPKPVVVAKPAVAKPVQKRIKVVFAIQKLAGLSGGAERVFVETAEAMGARNMDVRIVTFDPEGASSTFGSGVIPMQSLFPARSGGQQMAGAGFAVRALKALPNVYPITKVKWRVSHGVFMRAMRADLMAHPADVMVAFLPPAITAAAYATAGLPTQVVASTHNVPEQDFGDSARWDQNPVYRQRAKAALGLVARVTVLLPGFRSWFPQAVQKNVVVVANPVRRVSPASGTVARENIILGVGRLTAIKRWDVLITAFARIAPAMPGWTLRIFGEGPEQAALQAQIAALGMGGRVKMMGVTKAIGAAYDRAAILAHPSEFEGFGLSVAEAMAHGLPTVAFADCAGVNTLIVDGENGILAPRGPDAVDNLSKSLEKLAADAGLRTTLGAAATGVTARFDAAKIYTQWATLLRQVAGK